MYIYPIVQSFFKAREMKVPREVPASEAITDADFRQTEALPFTYLYEIVMRDAKKLNGVVDYAAYTLTFDPDLCPHICGTTGIRYGFLSLAGQPVLYYLLLDLVDLIKNIRRYEDLKPQYGS